MQKVNKYVDDGIIENLQTNDHKYYRGGCWGRYLDILPQLCRYSNDVVLISAPKGAGKTALADALMQDMQEGFKVALLKGNIKSTLEDVMKEIAKSFSMSWDSNSDDLEVNYDKRPWVLFVDDAHEYARDIVDNLIELSFSDTEDVKLHLVLLAEPNFTLDTSKFANHANNKIHTLPLEAYNLEETEAFLWYQWHLAGNDTKMPISGDILHKLYKSSEGVAGRIIEISKKLMSGEEIEAPKSKVKVNKYHIVGIVLLLLLYYVFGFILDVSNGKKTKDVNIADKVVPTIDKKVTATDNTKDNIVLSNSDNEDLSKNNIIKSTIKKEKSIDKNISIVANTTDSEGIAPNSDKLALKNKTEDKISELVKSKIATNKIVDIDETSELEVQAINKESVIETDKRLQVKEELILPPKLLETQVVVKDLNPRTAASADKTEQDREIKAQRYKATDLSTGKEIKRSNLVNKGKVVQSSEDQDIYSSLEKSLLGVNKHNYGWQIVASSNEAKVKSFIQEYDLHGAKYYSSKYDGKPWFVLIYGEYASKEEANNALKKLPSTISKMKPWLRSYDSIHSSIKQAKRK